jgi:hypothetical protein
VHEAEKLSLEQIEAFLNASQEIRFEGEAQKQIDHWIEQVLSRQEYHQQSRQARGLLRSYLMKVTGLSRAQVTRLIARYRKSGSLQAVPYRGHRFPQRYTRAFHQPSRGPVTQQTAHRTNQKPPSARQRQRTGRNQKWRRHPQTHGLRIYPGTPCACSSSTPPASTPISTTIVGAPKPISPSTRKAAAAACIAAIRPRWRPCWPCPTRRSTCVPDSPLPCCNVSRGSRSDTEAAQRMQQAKRQLFAPLRLPAKGPWKPENPQKQNRDFSVPWKAQTTTARFPHSHRPGYGC